LIPFKKFKKQKEKETLPSVTPIERKLQDKQNVGRLQKQTGGMYWQPTRSTPQQEWETLVQL
jgi:hypothetical protein